MTSANLVITRHFSDLSFFLLTALPDVWHQLLYQMHQVGAG